MAVNVKKSYVWTVVYEMNTKAIFYGNEFYLSSSESKIAFIDFLNHSSQVWFSYIRSHQFITSQFYYEPT